MPSSMRYSSAAKGKHASAQVSARTRAFAIAIIRIPHSRFITVG
ncbi:hypothetical protein FBZ89_11892 [Nitrospirillum amazonense]|uniref:Uncharacterized protein n=1 Tax=Nitrospirillum amazonense TaxID=28077 RepID=A0A560EXE2_9PROT|nr:hypothetical protein FBZ89_11892 [Nitrospirillum amazonense]